MPSVFVSLVVAPVLAFVGGLLLRPGWRELAYVVSLLGPLGVYTADLASYPPSPPGFWTWWLIGLAYLGLPLLLSLGISTLTFAIGRRIARNTRMTNDR